MYREPKAAKRLYFDVIPRNVDEYYQFLDGFERQDSRQQLSNPVWHIHSGKPPQIDMPISFNMLLTLVSSSNAENAETLWGFIGRYRPGVTPKTHPKLDAMVGYAIQYFRDFRSEEHTSELQSLRHLVCRLLLETYRTYRALHSFPTRRSSDLPPQIDMPISFNMLLTLVSSSNAENAETLWGFIGRYRPGVTPKTHPKLDAMVGYAIQYFRDF